MQKQPPVHLAGNMTYAYALTDLTKLNLDGSTASKKK